MGIKRSAVILLCLAVIVLFVAASGCARVGLSDDKTATSMAPTTLATPVPQSSSGTQPPQTLRVSTSTPVPAMITSVATPAAPAVKYSTSTCAGLGGFIVNPGSTCPGAWVDATDTFSCCAVSPVAIGKENITVTAVPLDLRLNLNDDPGRILP